MVKMKRNFNRRDFLKLSGLLPLSLVAPHLMRSHGNSQLSHGQKNILIIVFDAFSAYNISLYGYPRKTTPNIDRLAERATVYHNHFAGGNFTTTGTASLLTGTLPWTHRALLPNGRVADSVAAHNIFNAFQNYYRLAYTQNGWANTLLNQFQNDIDELIPWDKFFLGSYGGFIHALFKNDDDISTVSWSRNIKINEAGYSYSLFLSYLYEWLQDNKVADIKPQFPRGLPTTGSDNGFLLETSIDWMGDQLPAVAQPFLGYFHFLPPHAPYATSLEFFDRFKGDGLKPVLKPIDVLARRRVSRNLLKKRTEYDEFILYVDKAFGSLFNDLETSGLLDNTWVILTSDHGEMFERGVSGHSTNVLYQPVIRVPLLIFEPGQKTRVDINTTTSAIDLLPTLLHLTDQEIPDWTEGVILPPYAPITPDLDRKFYVVRANNNEQNEPITTLASTMMVKGRYKLHYYVGYPELQKYEQVDEKVRLFDIEADPDEMVDLSLSEAEITAELLGELKAKLAEVNKPYL
jgi:arylsulfatase A-like enzyme